VSKMEVIIQVHGISLKADENVLKLAGCCKTVSTLKNFVVYIQNR
jgi:hypothetical protein